MGLSGAGKSSLLNGISGKGAAYAKVGGLGEGRLIQCDAIPVHIRTWEMIFVLIERVVCRSAVDCCSTARP